MNDKIIKGIIRKGEYYDSVTLMRLAQKLAALPGVLDSAAVMASDSNKAILRAADMFTDDFESAGDNDLLIVLDTESYDVAGQVLGEIDKILSSLKSSDRKGSVLAPRTIESALNVMPYARLALISVAGRFAGDQARRALEAGLHVMLFSDNVPLETEIELKRYALSQGLFLMGPDCGSAIINGVPLGFANAVNRGDIGVVAASGTGLQEVSCIISNSGCGISQAIGTGSRDIGLDVGGIMFIEGIKALAKDNATKIILLVSKPPAPAILEKIEQALTDVAKPVVAIFLGAKYQRSNDRIYFAETLEEGALAAVAISKYTDVAQVRKMLESRDGDLQNLASAEAAKIQKAQRYIRGLFSGGTFCYESQVVLKGLADNIYSNSPLEGNRRSKDPFKSEKNTLVDMGADEFTSGRLHPMIDYSLRIKRMIQEAEDPAAAVVIFDIVLGFGAKTDPLNELAPAIADVRNAAGNRYVSFICSITGTENDPQHLSDLKLNLNKINVIVKESNAAACKLAGFITQELT